MIYRTDLVIVAYVLPTKANRTLLLKRANTQYRPNSWGFVGGNVEEGESPIQAAIRETKEEIGITIADGNLQSPLVVYRKDNPYSSFDFYFRVTIWHGNIENQEPSKCSELQWFSNEKIPTNAAICIPKVLAGFENKLNYLEIT